MFCGTFIQSRQKSPVLESPVTFFTKRQLKFLLLNSLSRVSARNVTVFKFVYFWTFDFWRYCLIQICLFFIHSKSRLAGRMADDHEAEQEPCTLPDVLTYRIGLGINLSSLSPSLRHHITNSSCLRVSVSPRHRVPISRYSKKSSIRHKHKALGKCCNGFGWPLVELLNQNFKILNFPI